MCAQQGVKDVQTLVKLAVVILRPLSAVFHSRIQAKGYLVHVAAGTVQPDDRAGGEGAVEVKGIGVKVQGLLLPVQNFVRLREGGHFLNARNTVLRNRLPIVGCRAGKGGKAQDCKT